MEIRDVVETDLQRITEIYNEVLTTSTAIFSDQPATVDERINWWKGRIQQGCPVLVAVTEERVLGFATFGDFRSWPGCRFTVEGTIHIDSATRGRGIGGALLKMLVERAQAAGKHVMIAGVDSANNLLTVS